MKKQKVVEEGVELYEVMYDNPSELYEGLKEEIDNEGYLRGIGRTLLKYLSGTAYVIADNPEGSWEFIHYFINDKNYGIWPVEEAFIDSPGVQGIKNRTEIAKDYIAETLEEKSQRKDGKISMIDLGSGAGTYGFYALKDQIDQEIILKNLDIDKSALEASKLLKENLKLNGKVDFVNSDAFDFLEEKSTLFDLAVSMGIIDYMRDEKAEEFLYKVRDNLEDDGHIITSVTDDYRFRSLTELVGMEDLVPRGEKNLENMLDEAGYRGVEVITDESKTQHIAKARK